MELASWLVPMILSIIGTGVSAGVGVSNTNKQIAAQEEAQRLQQSQANLAKLQQQAVNEQQTRMNDLDTINRFKNSLAVEGNNSGMTTTGNIGAGSIAGLNSQSGYLQEEDELNYAKCGGRFKKQFGGSNKSNSASMFVSPNNIPVKSANNSVVQYRDRLAQYKFGGVI